MSEKKWMRRGAAIYIPGGGFDVRYCPQPEATAEEIVTAVNYHDRLVEALFQLVEASEHSSESHYAGPKHVDDPWDEARALLAELERQS